VIKRIPLAVIITSCCHFVWAQSSSTTMGARANALGYASSCLQDEWSVFNNIGALAKLKATTAAFTYDAQPSFKPFNKAAAVFAVPLKAGVVGLGVYRFGDNLYNEQILTGGFSSTFGLASLGVKANYIQYNAKGFGRKGMLTISFGGLATLTQHLSVGAYIINLNQPLLDHNSGEHLPTVLVAGISLAPSEKTLIVMELEKDLDYEPTWKTGIAYQFHKKFSFRTGFNVNPNAGFFGLGFKPKNISFDYAYRYSPGIGARHQSTVGYNFNQPTK